MKPYVLGLTGGIGMGKSTTAAMFAAEGVPVWDADAVVHRLYAVGGAAVWPIQGLYPAAVLQGRVDRSVLKRLIVDDASVLNNIEKIVHPLVAKDRQSFIEHAVADIILLDIPLLFEGGSDQLCDGVAVVSVSGEVQRARVLDRGTMTAADLDGILARQMSDADKRARADWVIDTQTLDGARAMVHQILSEIRSDGRHA